MAEIFGTWLSGFVFLDPLCFACRDKINSRLICLSPIGSWRRTNFTTRHVISNNSHEVCEHRLLSSCGDDSDSFSLDTSNCAAHAVCTCALLLWRLTRVNFGPLPKPGRPGMLMIVLLLLEFAHIRGFDSGHPSPHPHKKWSAKNVCLSFHNVLHPWL